MRTPIVLSLLCASSSLLAAPLANPDTRFRSGANHHLGDDSFVAKLGRAPDAGDREKTRMKVHLEHVRALLAERPATKPALASRRAQMLGYLDDYIAKGITPTNAHLPWRSPVFIDDGGAICAVGYLIERSVGRALAERIAKEHEFEFLEDIAAAMPEVRDWIAGSGFTLEELASIQPAYSSPNVETWRIWDLAKHAPKDGPHDQLLQGFGGDRRVVGTFKNKTLHGTWMVKVKASDDENETGEVVVGTGTLNRGAGTWKSFYPDGKRVLATGSYLNNRAHGAWTFFHPSGHVAAKGQIVNGMRIGEWVFYYDSATKTPLARGTFSETGAVTGVWRHFDDRGKLLARTYQEGGNIIDITADSRRVTERVHAMLDPTGPVEALAHRLERFDLAGEKLFVQHSAWAKGELMFDANGFKLEHTKDGWTAADCKWSPKRKRIAASDNVGWLHQMLHRDSRSRSAKQGEYGVSMEEDAGPACGTAQPVAATRAKRLDTLLASKTSIRTPAPEFIKNLVLGHPFEGPGEPEEPAEDADTDEPDAEPEPEDKWETERRLSSTDLRSMLAMGTIDIVEWRHIDGRFSRVFNTLAGHYNWEWHSTEPEADGSSPLENNPRGSRY